MSFVQLVILGALAGFTIFLGLPVAALRGLHATTKGVLTGIATGILLFLSVEILSKVLSQGEAVVDKWSSGGAATPESVLTIVLLVVGISLGLVGIPLIERRVIRPLAERSAQKRIPAHAAAKPTTKDAGPQSAVSEIQPLVLSLSIAAGIGLHNFGEGLAIGQSAASGAVSLALILIIGFGLHNMTEGFGIAAPLTGSRPSGRFLLLGGLIGGGPTFIGTLVGASWTSPIATVIFLSIAGGSLVYVSAEMLGVGRHSLKKLPLMAAVGAGFFVGYATDLIVGLATGT